MSGRIDGGAAGRHVYQVEQVGIQEGPAREQVSLQAAPDQAGCTSTPDLAGLAARLFGSEIERRLAGGRSAADAKAVTALVRQGDPSALANDILRRFDGLVKNVQLGDTAPAMDPAEVARFQKLLGALEKDGQLGALRATLERADPAEVTFGVPLMDDAGAFYIGVLVHEIGTPRQADAWGPLDLGQG